AIAVTISPIRDGAAGRLEVGRGPYRPGLTVEDRQKLRTAEDTTGGVAEIRIRVSDHLASPAARAVGGLAYHFRLALSVVVIHLKLRVVGAGAYVATEINAPKAGAVELVGVDKYIACVAVLRVVLLVGRIPLENNFVIAVAVKVADRRVAGAVGI